MKSRKISPVEFRREVIPSRILMRDASGELTEALVPIDFRFDPLTGRSCHIVQFTLERIIRQDMEDLEKRSRELPCPFCPPLVDTITPRFPPDLVPEGVIKRGKALAFPNAGPYDVYGVVVVMSDEHFITLDRFTAEIVHNALIVAQDYIKSVEKADPGAKYHFIAWNYMPASGGSLVHPHVQSNAGYYPTGFQKQLLEASQRYFEDKGTNYWSDLIEQEKQVGERYIGEIGGTQWLADFSPIGRLSDLLAVFPGKASVTELNEDDLLDFSKGLLKVFSWLDGLNLVSFNMATYSGFDREQFWAHARLTPRGLTLYSPIETSDQFYYQVLQDENICILPPEVAAEKLKELFKE